MFTAYFDESEAATVYLIGGWVATDEEWAKFDVAWTAALKSEPSIQYFSHHDAKGVQGEFTAWENSAVAAKIDQLVDVICGHQMHGVVNGVKTTTWKKAFKSGTLSPKQVKKALKFTHPYQACFFGATSAVLQRQLEKGRAETVNFVFDEQTGLLKESIKYFNEFKTHFQADQKAIAGEIKVGDDRTAPALQAADLLCGEIATNLLNGSPGPAYQKLVACHEVASFKAYPPGFEDVPDLVKILESLSEEKKQVAGESRLAYPKEEETDP